jgi:HopA1 effector protein family
MHVLKDTFHPYSQERLLEALKDIARNLEIRPDFCIAHPSYTTFELDAKVRCRFEQLPEELKNKYLGLRLKSFLYGTYYNGSIEIAQEPDHNLTNSALNLENNIHKGADIKFYQQLHTSNSGIGYFDSGWLLKGQEQDGSLVVIKDGLTLHINREKHLSPAEQSAVKGNIVSVRMPKNLIQSGYYIAISDIGPVRHKIIEIYLNVSPEGAVHLMRELTQSLNEAIIPFALKALYNPSEYECHDPLILSFSRDRYEAIWKILQPVYTSYAAYFQPETPLFTKVLAPGLALAEEPEQKFFDQEDFGQNRCQVIANALMDARQEGNETAEKRMHAILNHFSLHEISLKHPYLNPTSEDIYVPLEIPLEQPNSSWQ